MKQHFICCKIKTLPIILISYYAVICLFSSIAHDYEPDLYFHDKCPACQWDILNQEFVSDVNNILDALKNSLFLVDFQNIPFFIDIPKQDCTFITFSRDPPHHV